jgi:hypothetical protein
MSTFQNVIVFVVLVLAFIGSELKVYDEIRSVFKDSDKKKK